MVRHCRREHVNLVRHCRREHVNQGDADIFTEQRGVLRGCVDRLLLFGLDDDVRSVLSAYTNQHVCRETNRKILRLYPLSGDSDVLSDSGPAEKSLGKYLPNCFVVETRSATTVG
ncbi:hypothetical protein ANCDUO_08681 [Ancylostoma duodenale]|uniref:Uncharacterized protein n=1 Tax=Ancylostoma duodenale TaxID=51022 RepID=A0A0C2GIM6_9BILA|nr:hypothetical protein ANCDUO_08681 [Ancylostoma duodenale]